MNFVYLHLVLFIFAVVNWLCIKPGIQEQGTECGGCWEWGKCYIPGNFIFNLFSFDNKNIIQFSESVYRYS